MPCTMMQDYNPADSLASEVQELKRRLDGYERHSNRITPMPCIDPREAEERNALKNQAIEADKLANGLSATLCGVFTVLEAAGQLDDVLAKFDAKEAGVSVEGLRQWWEHHKAADEIRRQREAAAK